MNNDELRNSDGSALLSKKSTDDQQRQAAKNIILNEIDQIFSSQNNPSGNATSTPSIDKIIAEDRKSVV